MRRFPLPLSRCTLARDVKLCAIARGGAAKSLSSRLLARGGTKLGNIVLNYSFERFPRVYTSSSREREQTVQYNRARTVNLRRNKKEGEREEVRVRAFLRACFIYSGKDTRPAASWLLAGRKIIWTHYARALRVGERERGESEEEQQCH